MLEFDGAARITKYIEKPELSYDVSMGVYVYEPSVLDYIVAGEYWIFPISCCVSWQIGSSVCAYPTDCLWLDIGRPDD